MRVPSCLLCALALLASATIPAQGRIKWRYSAQAAYFSNRPALAPDGTIYAIDVGGTLHAVAPDGTPRWRLSGVGRRGVDVGSNGIVYTGDETQVTAVRPDGTVLWNHRVSPVAHNFLGPTVGPDGNVYAVAASGEGILSLTPGGSVRWSTPFQAGRPWVTSQELVFRRGENGRDWFMVFSGFGHLAEVDIENGEFTDLSSGGNYQPAVGDERRRVLDDDGRAARVPPRRQPPLDVWRRRPLQLVGAECGAERTDLRCEAGSSAPVEPGGWAVALGTLRLQFAALPGREPDEQHGPLQWANPW